MISLTALPAPNNLPPIASGIGTPVALSLAFGGANYINPDITGGSTGSGTLIETISGPASSSYTTALTYTGSGYLEFLAWWGIYNASSAGTCEVRLTVDGVQIFTNVSAAAANIKCVVGGLSRANSLTAAGAAEVVLIPTPGRLVFRSSLLIEHKYTTSSGGQVGYKLVKTG